MAIESIGSRLIEPSWPGPGSIEGSVTRRTAESALTDEAAAPVKASAATFSDLLAEVIQTGSAAQQAADQYAAGKTQNIHETMLALKKADITFSLLVTVRNKMLEAYQTVMRMS